MASVLLGLLAGPTAQAAAPAGLDQIQTVVVLYGENRSFNNLYGMFPGANGIQQAMQNYQPQRDRDGLALFLVDAAADGVARRGYPTVDGLRAAGLGDVRQIGSGSIGATNVLRTGNKGLAAATLLLDALNTFDEVLEAVACLGVHGRGSHFLHAGSLALTSVPPPPVQIARISPHLR